MPMTPIKHVAIWKVIKLKWPENFKKYTQMMQQHKRKANVNTLVELLNYFSI